MTAFTDPDKAFAESQLGRNVIESIVACLDIGQILGPAIMMCDDEQRIGVMPLTDDMPRDEWLPIAVATMRSLDVGSCSLFEYLDLDHAGKWKGEWASYQLLMDIGNTIVCVHSVAQINRYPDGSSRLGEWVDDADDFPLDFLGDLQKNVIDARTGDGAAQWLRDRKARDAASGNTKAQATSKKRKRKQSRSSRQRNRVS